MRGWVGGCECACVQRVASKSDPGLAGVEHQMMPLLGLLAKAQREGQHPAP